MSLSVNSKLADLVANDRTKAVLAANGLPVDDPGFSVATGHLSLATMARIPETGMPQQFIDKVQADIVASYRDFDRVTQVGYIVKDSEAALNEFVQMFPVQPEYYTITEIKGDSLHMSWNGEMKTCHLKNGLANYQHMQFEFIQPLDDEDNFYTSFLKETGGGIHHINIACEDVEATIAALKAYGVAVESEGDLYGCPTCFFKLKNSDMRLELCAAAAPNGCDFPLRAPEAPKE